MVDVLIVGGGLAGLRLASLLRQKGVDFQVIEARTRLGGRILTQLDGGGCFDMGPAWFWPGQDRILHLINALGLQVFEQFSDGVLTFEDHLGRVERGRGHASMQGSLRLVGGLGALIEALTGCVPGDRINLNAALSALARNRDGVCASLTDGRQIEARRVVLALPPRLAADRVSFVPDLPDASIDAMSGIPTWMAGQAKAVAIYDRPFWREAGLSGDAMSRVGPMVEIHDASPCDGGPYALFGFIGVPASGRRDAVVLKAAVLHQLERLFGPKAATPRALHLKDWAFDLQTATQDDAAPLGYHPVYGLPAAMTGLWDGRIEFGSTEVAPQYGGFLEGALEAAENVLMRLSAGEQDAR